MACADFYMSLYNVVFTMAAPLVVGTINQDVSCATSRAFPGAINLFCYQGQVTSPCCSYPFPSSHRMCARR